MKLGLSVAVVALVVACLVPLLGDYYVHVFALVLTNVILAASLRPSLTCGQLNIGHSAFMCVGAYTSALLAKHFALPFEVTLLCGALLAALVGLAVGFALAAAAGALMAPIFKLDPMMGEQPLLKAFIIIILGGLGSIPGAILGGLILGLIDSIVATALGAEPAFLLSFVFIILLLLWRPTGLFGHAP